MNSQENTLDRVGFSYYAEPVVSHLHFGRGPVAGGTNVTVVGSSFRGGSEYRCRFGGKAWEVYGTYLAAHDAVHCVSPPHGAANASVEVSLNAQQFTASGVPFEFYELVRVSHIVPITGPVGGGAGPRAWRRRVGHAPVHRWHACTRAHVQSTHSAIAP